MSSFLKNHWAQIFFGATGLAFLAFCFYRLWTGDVAGAFATFAMAFFSFIWSNIARFKRFKGLGFEAELWEDKQKEAEHLIERLKAVVSVYTHEIVLGKVMQGRYGGGARWREHWRLYDELVERHSELGQNIDFSNLKTKMDIVFIFDMAGSICEPIRKAILDGRAEARKVIEKEFGSPIQDAEGFRRRNDQLSEVPEKLGDMFEISQDGDLAAHILEWAKAGQEKLKEYFGVEIKFDESAVEKLEKISRMYCAGPLEVSDELIELADGSYFS